MKSQTSNVKKQELVIEHKGNKYVLPEGSRVIVKPEGGYLIGFLASELQKAWW